VRPGELGQLVQAVIDQPLLKRYELSAASLLRVLEAELERGDEVLVVEEGGAPVGFAWFLSRGTFGGAAYLRLIALQPGLESRGHGAGLLAEMERRLQPRTRNLFLLVSHWNEAARRFYAAHGYREVGRLPGYIRSDTDEIICHKRLEAS
jgi:ribosomal protein S18 acetylase RimI-like enzyme